VAFSDSLFTFEVSHPERKARADHDLVRQIGGLAFSLEVNPRLNHIPALDGLRALAVLIIMLLHFKSWSLVPGGRVGVDLFFVLSGFLITTLLLQEWARFGSVSIRGFYLRRALRLLPAAAVFVAFYVAVSIAFREHQFTSQEPVNFILRNATFVATYSFNWLVVAEGDPRRGFSHLWSLSIEEQFYLIWPLILLLLLRARVSAARIMIFSALLFVASASLPIFQPGEWRRLYFGTDYRMHGLLAGCLVAELYVAGVLREPATRTPLFRCALIGAIVCLSAIVLGAKDDRVFLYAGGHTLAAVCASVLVVGVMFNRASTFTTILSNPVLEYVGKRSYALYLWHNAFAFWLRSLDTYSNVVLCFLISFAAAELSYRIVESPALSLKSRLGKQQRKAPSLATETTAVNGTAAQGVEAA
jgi:peptidoglycan/LPS O-acetylase OafA/YrhL